LKKVTNKGIKIRNIRCDNAGKNRKLEENAIKENMGFNFEYASVVTPQQNGVAERAFATLYGSIRAMFKRARRENQRILMSRMCNDGHTS